MTAKTEPLVGAHTVFPLGDYKGPSMDRAGSPARPSGHSLRLGDRHAWDISA
ncbi:hypothetical protein GCM10027521_24340 [Amycolatopsis cihanbeyliensis]